MKKIIKFNFLIISTILILNIFMTSCIPNSVLDYIRNDKQDTDVYSEEKPDNNPNENETDNNKETDKKDENSKKKPKEKKPVIEVSVGQEVPINGLSVKLDSVFKYTDKNLYFTKKGCQIIIVEYSFINKAEEGTGGVILNYNGSYCDDIKIDMYEYYYDIDKYNFDLTSSIDVDEDVKAGKKYKGYLVYELNNDWSTLEINLNYSGGATFIERYNCFNDPYKVVFNINRKDLS